MNIDFNSIVTFDMFIALLCSWAISFYMIHKYYDMLDEFWEKKK